MSAWDIAGAVVWSAFAAFFIVALFNSHTNGPGKIICLLFIAGTMPPAVYCIARLFGAHA